eukprot:gene30101-36356_t
MEDLQVALTTSPGSHNQKTEDVAIAEMSFETKAAHGRSVLDHCAAFIHPLRPPNRLHRLRPILEIEGGLSEFTLEAFWHDEKSLLELIDCALAIFVGKENLPPLVVNTKAVISTLWKWMNENPHPLEEIATEQPQPDASHEEELMRFLRDWYLESAANYKISVVEKCCTSLTRDKTTACTSGRDATTEVRGAHFDAYGSCSSATGTTTHLNHYYTDSSASSNSSGGIYPGTADVYFPFAPRQAFETPLLHIDGDSRNFPFPGPAAFMAPHYQNGHVQELTSALRSPAGSCIQPAFVTLQGQDARGMNIVSEVAEAVRQSPLQTPRYELQDVFSSSVDARHLPPVSRVVIDMSLLDHVAPLVKEVAVLSTVKLSSPANTQDIDFGESYIPLRCKDMWAAMCRQTFSNPNNRDHRIVDLQFVSPQGDDELLRLMVLRFAGELDCKTVRIEVAEYLRKRYVWPLAIEKKPCFWKRVVVVVTKPVLPSILEEFYAYMVNEGSNGDFAALLMKCWRLVEECKALPNDFSDFWANRYASFLVRAGLVILFTCFVHHYRYSNKMISSLDKASLVRDSGFYNLEDLKDLGKSRLKEDPNFFNTKILSFNIDEDDVPTANILKSFLNIAYPGGEVIPTDLERIFSMALYWYCNRAKVFGLTSGYKSSCGNGKMAAFRVKRIYHLVSNTPEKTHD